MNGEYLSNIIIAIISSNFLVEIARYLIGKIGANDKLEERFGKIESRLDGQDLGITRTQLLFLMYAYPKRTDEIMKVSHQYFVEQKGDWYMTELFNKWLEEQELNKPAWLK